MAIDAPYQGVILAAGQGTRMGPFGDHFPKALIPVCNRPLISYQLEHFRSLGIERIIVVIGYLGECIRETLGDGSDYGVQLEYVEQTERLGLAHAVGQLESYIHGPFVLMLGDIYWDVVDFEAMLRLYEASDIAAVLAVKEETEPEAVKRNFSVELHEDGRVRRVIEKPKTPTTRLKGCGLYVFDQLIFEAIEHTPRSDLRNEYELTDAIQVLIDGGASVRVAEVVKGDINLTYISDIVDSNVYELRKRKTLSLQGEGVRLAPGCRLHDTVLGDHVQIPQAITLEECIVLDHSVIHATTTLRRAVITPHAILT